MKIVSTGRRNLRLFTKPVAGIVMLLTLAKLNEHYMVERRSTSKLSLKLVTPPVLLSIRFLPVTYIFLLRQAGKAGVFYSADKCFETGADSRNIFDKQIVKVWTPCLSAFYCVIPRATLAWSLKVCAIARFSKSARARTKNSREPP